MFLQILFGAVIFKQRQWRTTNKFLFVKKGKLTLGQRALVFSRGVTASSQKSEKNTGTATFSRISCCLQPPRGESGEPYMMA